jgi:hypothetical protein
MKKTILLMIALLLSSVCAFADSYWKKPMFINNTNFIVKDVKLKTQAQGKAKYAFLDKNIKSNITPYELGELAGKLGGYFENSSTEGEDWTEWNIELICEDSKGNTHYFYSIMEFNNQRSNGPAISLWPKTKEICKQNSKFILKPHGKSAVLGIEIYTKNGKLYNTYEFNFQEVWVETFNGRTMLTI